MTAYTLPSGARYTLRLAGVKPEPPHRGALFGDAIAVLERGAMDGDPRDLALGDFHVLRAILTKHGLLEEEAIEVDCLNCGAILAVRPCAGLETGPWEDGEIDDELDRPLAPEGLELAPRTVRDALPLFAALAREPLTVNVAFVEAMGLVALGSLREPKKIARRFSRCSDDDFATITAAWLDYHYVLRLACEVFCPKCKARNTVDAPYDREFERSAPEPPADAQVEAAFPAIDAFVEAAHTIGDPLLAEITDQTPTLLVDDGTPPVDDGGVPLLGGYLPPPPPDAAVPTRPPTITVYYRTFAAAARDEPDFDWRRELEETIEHELDHHLYFLRGDDPMDEEEHAEIDREVVRVVGRQESTRRTLTVFAASFPDFFRRAWPLLLIAALVLAITIGQSRCEP